MANYQVKKRPLTWQKVVKNILYWLFPLTCAWGLTQFIFNLVFGRLIAHIVLPAISYKPEDFPFSLENLRKRYLYAKWQAEIHKVTTPDGANLSTLEIIHDTQKHKPINEQAFVIFLLGNGVVYQAPEVINEMITMAEELRCNIVGFNYREVLDPKPTKKIWSKTDFRNDGGTQVQHLLDQGVLPQNIILYGHSLSGGVACLVAKDFHQQKLKVKLFDKASFSNLTNVVMGFIRRLDILAMLVNGASRLQVLLGIRKSSFSKTYFSTTETWFGTVLSWLVYPFLKFILVITDWEMEAASAYHTIPDGSKEYLTVRADKIVSKYADLHATLKEERRGLKYLRKKIERAKQIIKDCDAKIESFTQKSLTNENLQTCQQELNQIHRTLLKALRATYRTSQYTALQLTTQSILKHLKDAIQALEQRKQILTKLQCDPASSNLSGLNLSISTYAQLSLTCLESAQQAMQARKMDEKPVYKIQKKLREHGQERVLKYSAVNLKALVDLFDAAQAFIDCNGHFKYKPKFAANTKSAREAYEYFRNNAQVHFKDDQLIQTLTLYFDLEIAEAEYTCAVIHHKGKHPEKDKCLQHKEQCESAYKNALEKVSANAVQALLAWVDFKAIDVDMHRAHMTPLSLLRNGCGQSGFQFFTDFVHRTMTIPPAVDQMSISLSCCRTE